MAKSADAEPIAAKNQFGVVEGSATRPAPMGTKKVDEVTVKRHASGFTITTRYTMDKPGKVTPPGRGYIEPKTEVVVDLKALDAKLDAIFGLSKAYKAAPKAQDEAAAAPDDDPDMDGDEDAPGAGAADTDEDAGAPADDGE